MIYALLVLWLWLNTSLPIDPISRNNQARREAEAAYRAGQYDRALTLYTVLSRTTPIPDPAVQLDLGHTYFNLRQYQKAADHYRLLLSADRPDLRTAAATQLGVIACLDRDSSAALTLFQQALLEDFSNEPARYNFELVKKQYRHTQPPTKPTTVARTAGPSNRPKSGGGQVERSSRQDELLRRFQRLNLTQEQAMQLLDAMQRDDLPYALTQSARRSTKPAPAGNRW